MNYQAHYDRLISSARGRTIGGYRERHHVLPRCMGGDDALGNLVDLTPEEHFVAHQLLVKMYPEVIGLVHAATRMARQCTGNKAFGWLRRRLSAMKRGKTLAAETRAKMSAVRTGKTHSLETRAKLAALKRGKVYSIQMREKVGAASRGRTASPETRAKMSAAQRANPHRLGKKHSQEARAKIRAARALQVFTPEHRANLSVAGRAVWARRKLCQQSGATSWE